MLSITTMEDERANIKQTPFELTNSAYVYGLQWVLWIAQGGVFCYETPFSRTVCVGPSVNMTYNMSKDLFETRGTLYRALIYSYYFLYILCWEQNRSDICGPQEMGPVRLSMSLCWLHLYHTDTLRDSTNTHKCFWSNQILLLALLRPFVHIWSPAAWCNGCSRNKNKQLRFLPLLSSNIHHSLHIQPD